jgi:outer membrane protein assembly factor BamB
MKLLKLGIPLCLLFLAACSGELTVETNTPPEVTLYTPLEQQGADVTVVYDLFDPEGSTCRLTVYYSGGSAGDTWLPATVAESVTAVEPGLDLTFTWQSDIDEVNRAALDYRLRVVPFAGEDLGAAATSGYMHVRNTTDGTMLWSRATSGKVTSSPALDGTTLYATDTAYAVYSLNAATGAIQWKKQDYIIPWSSLAPMVDDDGNVYARASAELYSFLPNGEERWCRTFSSNVSRVPTANGTTLYAALTNGELHAVDTANGDTLWSQSGGTEISSPAIASGGELIYTDGGSAIARDAAGDLLPGWPFMGFGPAFDGSGCTVSIGADGMLHMVDGAGKLIVSSLDGMVTWNATLGGEVRQPPAVAPDGTIYVGTDGARLLAVDPVTRELAWSFQAGGDIQCVPAIAADGTVIFGATDGLVYAVNPDGSLQWTFDALFSVISSPVIGLDGTVYVGSSDYHVYAIRDENGGPATTGWPMFGGNPRHTGQEN